MKNVIHLVCFSGDQSDHRHDYFVAAENGTPEKLREDYWLALNVAKESNPKEWDLSDVKTNLKQMGWEFIKIPDVSVSY
jgi:hypothetical protein